MSRYLFLLLLVFVASAPGAENTPAMKRAEAKLADQQDEAVLSRTLFGVFRVQDMTEDQTQTMISAAEHRVEYQKQVIAEKQILLDAGALAPVDLKSAQAELADRERMLALAHRRVQMWEELRQMALEEDRYEQAAKVPPTVMLRYPGNGVFQLSELPELSSDFAQQFHRPLPVSANGQTHLHDSLGLDHRNKVDVALAPDSPEGAWFRRLLEAHHVPYLAFRAAVPGAATAPHIHIGTPSTRFKTVG